MKFKILIYSILSLFSCLLAFYSNYAMVYRITSAFVSWCAVLISIGYFSLILFTKRGWVKKDSYLIFLWIGPLLYSVNRWALLIIILIFYLGEKLNLPDSTKSKIINEKEPKSIIERARLVMPSITIISFAFLLVDIVREFTVWKTIVFNNLPAACFLLALLIQLYFIFPKIEGRLSK